MVLLNLYFELDFQEGNRRIMANILHFLDPRERQYSVGVKGFFIGFDRYWTLDDPP